MACSNCTSQILAANEQKRKILEEALALANQTGEWVAIYTDEHGQTCYCPAGQAGGYIITRFITPGMQDPSP